MQGSALKYLPQPLTPALVFILTVFGLFPGLSGCIDRDLSDARVGKKTLPIFDHYSIYRQRHFILPDDARVFVAKPVLSGGLRKQYPYAARDIQLVQTEALQRYFPQVQKARQTASLDAALREALANGQQFLVYPSIVVWHETQLAKKLSCSDEKVDIKTPKGISQISSITNCEWDFSIPFDKVHLAVFIYDVGSGQHLDTLSVHSESGMMTFFGDVPKVLLNKPLNEVANILSGG